MTDNSIIRKDGATVGHVQESAATIDDNGSVNIPTGETYDINGTPHTHTGLSTYDSDVIMQDITTNNADSDNHGFLPKLSGDSDTYLDGVGTWGTPAGSVSGLFYGPTLTAPSSASYSWINQGSATVSDDADGMYMYNPAEATYNLRILKKTAPATPYTITMMAIWNYIPTNYINFGLVFRQSSDGKLVSFGPYYNGGLRLHCYEWTNPTTYSAAYLNDTASISALAFKPFLFFRIADDGTTNRVSSYSFDGTNYITAHSVGRTDFLTADEVGVYVQSGQTTYPVHVKILHWSEA